MRTLACVALLLAATEAGELVSVEREANAFFARERLEAKKLGRIAARWRLPDLGSLLFVEVHHSRHRFFGWRLDARHILVGPYRVRRIDESARVEPADAGRAARRLLASRLPSPDMLVVHWIAALRRGDNRAARELWKRLVGLYEYTGGWDSSARHYVTSSLLLHWRTSWYDFESPELAVAALDAAAAVAPDAALAASARRQRHGVLATPAKVPAAPKADATAVQKARALVLRLRQQRTAASMNPGGSLAMINWSGDSPAARLHRLGRHAYPELVKAIDHKGLTGEYIGNLGWREYCTYGTLASTILRRSLGWIDEPAIMRAWIQSGTWRDRRETLKWFALHSRNERIQTDCARRLAD